MEKKGLPERVKENAGSYTYDDYANLPDDGKRYELADGILQLLPSATPSHQSVRASLQFILTLTCQDEYVILGAPLDVILSPSSRKRDKIDKAAAYARYGIPEYWIVDAASATLDLPDDQAPASDFSAQANAAPL